jgi:hypothetical protein
MRSTLNPIYNAHWIVTGIPETGFTMNITLINEDSDCTDGQCLGRLLIDFLGKCEKKPIGEGWDTGEVDYKVKKKQGALKTHVATYLAACLTHGKVNHHARVWVKARVLEKAADQTDRRVSTVGPRKTTIIAQCHDFELI